jgi:hypothetical protein
MFFALVYGFIICNLIVAIDILREAVVEAVKDLSDEIKKLQPDNEPKTTPYIIDDLDNDKESGIEIKHEFTEKILEKNKDINPVKEVQNIPENLESTSNLGDTLDLMDSISNISLFLLSMRLSEIDPQVHLIIKAGSITLAGIQIALAGIAFYFMSCKKLSNDENNSKTSEDVANTNSNSAVKTTVDSLKTPEDTDPTKNLSKPLEPENIENVETKSSLLIEIYNFIKSFFN